ncbi:MAG: aldo/keto reductase [Eggerthellaceae bacterium]|nr:aldo/keto reductase [Eggerthellaceae bacterium]
MSYLGESIPKLGFGLMRLPKLEDDSIDVEQVKQMVDLFLEAGCTYFDTARAYDGSEAAIRQALVERYPRESYQLATKIPAWRRETAADARSDFDISLEETGAGYFDFYLIHNTGGPRTAAFDKFGIWDFVKQLKADGKVRHIGFSHHDNAEKLDEIMTAHPEMEFVQLQVNYADWENASTQSRKCVEVAQKHGKPVIIMEPVRGGTLATPPEPVAEVLRAESPDRAFPDWALRFAMGVPNLITVLSGMSNVQQMKENLQTWRTYEPLTDAELDALRLAKEKLDELLDNPCTNCQYCMAVCPKSIRIAPIMESLNRAGMYGTDNGKFWCNFQTMAGGKASECIQCFQCESACPQHIEIVGKLQRAAELFE